MQHAGIGSPLDDLVTHLATELMSVSVRSLQPSLELVVRTLAEFFQVSTSFLRRNDHALGASILVAEWPVRENVPDPDPIGVVPFEGPDTDPVFAAVRDLREAMVIRPHQQEEYQSAFMKHPAAHQWRSLRSLFLREEITSGVLGFINFGDRAWSKAELNALRAVASLLSQLEARVEAEERLQQGAYHDELTGLPNRRALWEALATRLEGDSAEPVPVIFADLDRLKAVNDSFGHATGDALLRQIAERLDRAVGPDDLVARLGGDEFVFVLGGCPNDPLSVTRDIIAAVTSLPFDLENMKLATISVCAGIALGAPGKVSVGELLHRADVALSGAKAAGPGQVLLFDEEMLVTSEVRADINRYLRHAVSHHALELYYLPEIDLRDGALVAVEALVRWHHPTLGLLLPGSFIPLAEESPSALTEIGEWVLHEACRQLASWRVEFPLSTFIVRVNVSPVQLMIGDMATVVSAALSTHHLKGTDLCLEVTERAVLHEMDHVLSVLKAVRELGVTVALDDFGTGYSTLTQLRWLPVDTLKVDRQFITELGSNAGDLAIVESTILLAHNFGLDVVAEGVESTAAARELLRMGCYRAEGHLIHSAAPPRIVERLVARGGVQLSALGLSGNADGG